MGLSNALTTLQHAIDLVLAWFEHTTSLVYLDDTIVLCNNLDDHINDVRNVMRVLQDVRAALEL